MKVLAACFVALCFFGTASPARSQVLVSPALSEKEAEAAKTAEPTATVISIHGAAEPDPAFRIRFWPASQDRRNVNMMPFVSRAVLMTAQKFATNPDFSREYSKMSEEWSNLSLDELPVDLVRKKLQQVAYPALTEIERAENLMLIDYDLLLTDLTAAEMIQTLLPDLQQMRSVGRLISLRSRLAAAEGRWDDFARDCRLGFRLAEAAGRNGDFLVGRLVGFAIAGMTLHNIQEAIQQPGCPNFYWALTTLPAERLFETRESIEFESVLLSRLIDTKSLPNEPIGVEAARVMIRKLSQDATEMFSGLGDEAGKLNAQFLSGAYVVLMADEAREILETTEQWKGRTKELSAPEAVLRSTDLRIARMRDEWLKWALLPPELAGEYRKEIDKAVEADTGVDVLRSLVLQLTPAVRAAQGAGTRSRQHRNFLLTLESLRMYASANGELPKKLDALRPVPAWYDTITRKPFEYLRTSPTTATLLREARHPGDKKTNFEIQLLTEAAK